MFGSISVREASQKWGLPEKRVYQYCKEGRIPGLKRHGRVWRIPENAERPVELSDVRQESGSRLTKETVTDKYPLPLMAASFLPGESLQLIDALKDEEMKILAASERCYYRSEGEQCTAMAAGLVESPSYPIKISAALMTAFGSLCAGNPQHAITRIKAIIQAYEKQVLLGIERTEEEEAYAALVRNLATVLLHLTKQPFVKMDVKRLPEGIRLIGFYVLAHHHYLEAEYGQAAGVCETALSLCGRSYPIGEIYLHLMLSITYMNLSKKEKAKAHFLDAWRIAKPDGFIQPFAEHHGLLQGMIETHLRKSEPEAYERIIRQVYLFAGAWREVHNPESNHKVADNLTTTEFTAAMLANRGWSNERIAKHLGVTLNTIRTHMASVYKKLNISSRKQLHQYMLK